MNAWQRAARGQSRVERAESIDQKRAMLAAMGIKAPPSGRVESS